MSGMETEIVDRNNIADCETKDMHTYKIGDKVLIMSNGENVEAIIRDMIWHYKKIAYMYYLLIDGKRKAKRYFKCDVLAKLN